MDIRDLGYIYFVDGITKIKQTNRNYEKWSSNSYILGFVNFFLRFLHSLLMNGKKFVNIPKGYNGCLFFGVSINNKRSLIPIINNLDKKDVSVDILSVKSYPDWKLYYYALPHLFNLIREIKLASHKERLIIKAKFPIFWRMYGNERLVNDMIKKYNPKVIVLSNDHNDLPRSINAIAKKRGIKTIYIQHASIGKNFPPLSFSYSFLDGKETYEKYCLNARIEGNIYLSGGVRFDSVIPHNKNKTEIRTIGVALNILDDQNIVKELVSFLVSKSNEYNRLEICLRPHPTLNLSRWKKWCKEKGVLFSSPKEESSFMFLSKIDILISNESAIHLDAAMSRVRSIIYNMSNSPFNDVYGYRENNLAPFFCNLNDVYHYIIDRTDISNNEITKYYNSSFGTSYERNLASVLAYMIHCILTGKEADFNRKYGFKPILSSADLNVFTITE